MLALLTQRLAEKIFARQHSGTQHRALSECEPCTLFLLLQSIHTASPESTSTPNTSRIQTCGTHGHTRSKVSETPSQPPDEKTPPHKRPLLMQGEALLFGRTMSVLTFLCLHIFKHQKQQKEGRERKKKEVRQACKPSRWHVQTYTRSPYLLNSFLFNNHVDLLHILWSGLPNSHLVATLHRQEAFR